MFALPPLPRRAAGPVLLLGVAALLTASVRADGPADNIPDKVRSVPPVGIDLPPADADAIRKGLTELQGLIKDIGQHDLLPDVEVYEKAVRYAVDHKEVFDARGIPAVKRVLAAGLERAKQLKAGQHPWTTQTGYVVRGYRSKIDGSPQPYGLTVPKEYEFQGQSKHRLDFWWHGRGEQLSEVNFMAGTQSAGGIIPVPGQFILYPYGRYCNANKFAGEIDSFEALDHARKFYRIDDSRLVARGFSMGGAACWQYAVHYPTFWCANAPGAGFSETPEFLKVFQKENVSPPWYEQKLWQMYNASDYALNIFDLPTVAYSGEKDSQKQAADVMEREMKKVGLKLVHVIGPGAGHSYEKGAKAEVNRLIDEIVAKGKPALPKEIKFVTYTLRYNQCGWVTVEGLERHWQRAEVDGEIKADGSIVLKTKNVTALTLNCSFGSATTVKGVTIDGQSLGHIGGNNYVKLVVKFANTKGMWGVTPAHGEGGKVPGLQGPIDDAFMDRFVMVKPTGALMSPKTNEWAEKEMKHAVDHWRKQFRGDAPVKLDTAVTDDDIKNANLILWGDPKSNAVLAKIADKLPVKWTEKGVVVGGQTYDAATHVPVLIYPNPLNPKRYVVLNSGFTFREYDYLNNARQVSKLPDYAVIDVTTPPTSRYPGKVVRAGFFGEKWELLPDDRK
jgi:pimeloyl-ACP methyl ester carboxylesterase